MRHVIARATRRLDMKSESSKTGSKFVSYVSRHYNIMRADYAAFARHVADVMLTTDMSLTCGMNRVCFYMWHHGMRLEKRRRSSRI